MAYIHLGPSLLYVLFEVQEVMDSSDYKADTFFHFPEIRPGECSRFSHFVCSAYLDCENLFVSFLSWQENLSIISFPLWIDLSTSRCANQSPQLVKVLPFLAESAQLYLHAREKILLAAWPVMESISFLWSMWEQHIAAS